MLEYPESHILATQINRALKNRKIVRVIANSSPHKFAWFNGSSSQYPALLKDRTIKSATAFGGMLEIDFDGVYLVIGDGTNLTWHSNSQNIPSKHQLLLELDDHSAITCSVQMYGGIWAFKVGAFDNPYYLGAKKAIPLDESDPTLEYFLEKTQKYSNLSLKVFLATEQRFAGLGNGVLQDILFKARMNPRTNINTLTSEKICELHSAIVKEIQAMIQQGGRGTESDLFGQYGRYLTLSQRYANKEACPNCQSAFVKEAYMGGSVYYCPACQPVVKS